MIQNFRQFLGKVTLIDTPYYPRAIAEVINFISPNFVSKFYQNVNFPAADNISMVLKKTNNFLLGGHFFLVKNPPTSLANNLFGTRNKNSQNLA